jgi:hypothetical protein
MGPSATTAIAEAHRSEGNRAVGRALLQRWPAGTVGVAGQCAVGAGTILYHGTQAAQFGHGHLAPAGPNPIHFQHPPVPDAPAWFAPSVLFAMHAGVRTIAAGAHGQIWLFQYPVRQEIRLLRFNDVADLSGYLLSQEATFGPPRPPLHANDIPAALRLWHLYTTLDGYRLDADPVRGEPEIVLFPAGLQKLQLGAADRLQVTPQPPLAVPGLAAPIPYHQLTTGLGHHMGYFLHTGGPGTFV